MYIRPLRAATSLRHKFGYPRIRRFGTKVPGFDWLYPQVRSSPETKPAVTTAFLYWVGCAVFVSFMVRKRKEDAFNSPPFAPGYYATKERRRFLEENPKELEMDEISDDYTKWRYKNALEQKVKPVQLVFLKNIKFFEEWKHDLNIMILGSGFCFDLDMEYLPRYVGENGKVFLVDQDTSTTIEALKKQFGDDIPKQFVVVENDIAKTILNEDNSTLESALENIQPGEKWTAPFPSIFENKMDIVVSGLILSQIRMESQTHGEAEQCVESHCRVLDTLRKDRGHILIHDDSLLAELFETRVQILNGLERINMDAHLRYDWPPDNIVQFPSINDFMLQTYMVHVRSSKSPI